MASRWLAWSAATWAWRDSRQTWAAEIWGDRETLVWWYQSVITSSAWSEDEEGTRETVTHQQRWFAACECLSAVLRPQGAFQRICLLVCYLMFYILYMFYYMWESLVLLSISCLNYWREHFTHWLYVKMDDCFPKVKPNHLDRPLEVGRSIDHKPCLLHVRWCDLDQSKKSK